MTTQTPSLSGPKVLLQGDSGTGKTYSLGTLVDWGAAQNPPVDVFVLFVENGLETLLGYWRDKGKPVPENCHWHVIQAPTLTLESLTDMATKVGLLSYEALTKQTDPNRSKNNVYERILKSLANFPDDRTGKTFGNIGGWGVDKILCIDSLSMLAEACMRMVVGAKPTASQPDYGVGQNNLIGLLRYLTQSLVPALVMTAHVQRQVDEITGSVKLTTRAIGKALGDDIPPLFSEVLYAVRDGANWSWDTAAAGVITKTRYLPIAAKQKPDFATILDKWKVRGQT